VERDFNTMIQNAVIYNPHNDAHGVHATAIKLFQECQEVFHQLGDKELLCHKCDEDVADDNMIRVCDYCCIGIHDHCLCETRPVDQGWHPLRQKECPCGDIDTTWFCSDACESSFERIANLIELSLDEAKKANLHTARETGSTAAGISVYQQHEKKCSNAKLGGHQEGHTHLGASTSPLPPSSRNPSNPGSPICLHPPPPPPPPAPPIAEPSRSEGSDLDKHGDNSSGSAVTPVRAVEPVTGATVSSHTARQFLSSDGRVIDRVCSPAPLGAQTQCPWSRQNLSTGRPQQESGQELDQKFSRLAAAARDKHKRMQHGQQPQQDMGVVADKRQVLPEKTSSSSAKKQCLWSGVAHRLGEVEDRVGELSDEQLKECLKRQLEDMESHVMCMARSSTQ